MMRADSALCAMCSEGQNMHFALKHTQDPDTKLKRVQNRLSGPNPFSTRTKYNGRTYRSRWEARYAYYLDLQGLTFEYEKHIIPYVDTTGHRHHYIPDFWVPAWNSYVEVKGYWLPESQGKMRLIYEQHADLQILLIEQAQMVQVPDLPDVCKI